MPCYFTSPQLVLQHDDVIRRHGVAATHQTTVDDGGTCIRRLKLCDVVTTLMHCLSAN